jgi:hypothetical protein
MRPVGSSSTPEATTRETRSDSRYGFTVVAAMKTTAGATRS